LDPLIKSQWLGPIKSMGFATFRAFYARNAPTQHQCITRAVAKPVAGSQRERIGEKPFHEPHCSCSPEVSALVRLRAIVTFGIAMTEMPTIGNRKLAQSSKFTFFWRLDQNDDEAGNQNEVQQTH
jgi:hypothetical protein